MSNFMGRERYLDTVFAKAKAKEAENISRLEATERLLNSKKRGVSMDDKLSSNSQPKPAPFH